MEHMFNTPDSFKQSSSGDVIKIIESTLGLEDGLVYYNNLKKELYIIYSFGENKLYHSIGLYKFNLDIKIVERICLFDSLSINKNKLISHIVTRTMIPYDIRHSNHNYGLIKPGLNYDRILGSDTNSLHKISQGYLLESIEYIQDNSSQEVTKVLCRSRIIR